MRRDVGREQERGYILIGVLILVTIAALVAGSTLELTGSAGRSALASAKRSEEFFGTEETLGKAVSWLRTNSTSMVDPFSRTNFYTYFDRTTPTTGSNDTSYFTVPTKIKRQGTQEAVILANESSLATGWFPATTDTATGSAFAPLTSISTSPLGSKKVRITLVDAIPVDSTKDFGDTDSGNAAPQTDFQPIYRVDSMDSLTRGAHLFGYLVGTLQYDFGVGFYGRDYLEVRQECDSYLSNNGPYSSASKRANCSTGSNTEIRIHQNEEVYGTARTNGAITATSPYGGKVCSDFASGCPNAGQTCSGSSCQVPGLPAYSSWSTYCPTNQGSVTPASGTILTVAGDAPSQKCWSNVTVGNNRVVTLSSTTTPYFIDTLNIANNGRLNFAPSPSTGTITLYVRTITGDRFNGNQVFNQNNKPYQVRINYLGTNDLLLNGTATMHSFIVAPYAAVNVQGNFTFAGGIKATRLTFTGSGTLHYDESGDITTLKDVTYALRSVTQRYR